MGSGTVSGRPRLAALRGHRRASAGRPLLHDAECRNVHSFRQATKALVVAGLELSGEMRQGRARLLSGLAGAAASWGLILCSAVPAKAYVEIPYEMPEVKLDSSNKALELTRKLSAVGAKMYGAFWCSHCYEQKQYFGVEAVERGGFPYVECYPSGYKTGMKIADACEEAGITAFPTWIINGNRYEGEMTFDMIDDALSQPPKPDAPAKAGDE